MAYSVGIIAVNDEKREMINNLVQLARLGLKGERKQVEAYVRRLARTLSSQDPEASLLLAQLAGAGAPLRRADTAERNAPRLIPVDQESRWDLLRIDNAPHVAQPPVLNAMISTVVEQLIRERQRINDLIDAGLEPSRTILFTGAPGVGKTLTAHWIAERLDKPLFTLDLASVMSSLLGKTGSNVRAVLDFAKNNDGILLLDEFDAVAKRRNDESEVGELKRLVTVILQEIDLWPANRLLIAATNHSELLDPAIWRRFDMIVDFPLPEPQALKQLLRREMGDVADPAWERVLMVLFSGRSFSDVTRALRSVRRRALLTDTSFADRLAELVREEVQGLPKRSLKEISVELENAGVTQRLISEMTGLSRDTIRRARTMEDKDG